MKPDPVGLLEIADHLHVAHNTVKSWRQRELLPDPRWTVSGAPAWDWELDIIPWARKTGRID